MLLRRHRQVEEPVETVVEETIVEETQVEEPVETPKKSRKK